MKIGSLFSGAGALDMAVECMFGAETVWQCEKDVAASKVLSEHWPGVLNHVDVTTTVWADIEPVDILCGGYPCQPFSAAGQRKGVNDERHLWPYFAEAIRQLRPRFVVLENVAGHRSMGFDRVLGDLAEARYDAQWCSVRASDVGAPHRRERLFILATDTSGERHGRRQDAGMVGRVHRASQSEELQRERSRQVAGDRSETSTPNPARDGWHEGWHESAGLVGGSDAAVSGAGPVNLLSTPRATRGGSNTETVDLLPTPMAHDAKGTGPSGFSRNTPELSRIDHYFPTPRTSDTNGAGADGDGGLDLRTAVTLLQTPSVAYGEGGHLNRSGSRKGEQLLPGQAREMATNWGKYEPAIRRWESLTRPAPSPTEPNTKGNPRLSARFSEWLMGWPEGWVTDVPGISRNDALRIIGNGVVSSQAEYALRYLLSIAEVAA